MRWAMTMVLVVVAGCAPGAAPLAGGSESETVAVLLAALDHHLPDGLAFDSVAFDIGDVTPAQAKITREFAARFDRPLVPAWESLSCDPEITIPRRCEIDGSNWVVRVGVPEFEGNRAVVGVGLTWEIDRRVHGNFTVYELESRDGRWVVIRALRGSAT